MSAELKSVWFVIRRYVIHLISSHLWGIMVVEGEGSRAPRPLVVPLLSTVQPLCCMSTRGYKVLQTLYTEHEKTHTLVLSAARYWNWFASVATGSLSLLKGPIR